jgi:hypothetical protein
MPIIDLLLRLALVAWIIQRLLFVGASWTVMLAGIISWAIAVSLKIPTYRLLGKIIPVKSPFVVATRIGLASAALELGTTAAYFAYTWKTLTYPDVVAFGATVGCFEVFFVMGLGIWAATRKQQPAPADGPQIAVPAPAVQISSMAGLAQFIERTGTLILHTGSRGLIYVAFVTASLLPAAIAVLIFAALDGLAIYGAVNKWNFLARGTFFRFYGTLWALAILSQLLFVTWAG